MAVAGSLVPAMLGLDALRQLTLPNYALPTVLPPGAELEILLGLTVLFLVVVVALPAFARYMHVATTADSRYLLVAADASVPFRTSAAVVAHYDADSVARLLDDDFHRHGPPLVWRADRARMHRTDAVREVVLVWPDGAPAPEPFLQVLRETFLPSRALAGAAEGAVRMEQLITDLLALSRVVPFGKVWRTGANEATSFTTSANLVADGVTVWQLAKEADGAPGVPAVLRARPVGSVAVRRSAGPARGPPRRCLAPPAR